MKYRFFSELFRIFEELSIGKFLNKLMKIVDLTRNLFQGTQGRKDIVHVIPSNTQIYILYSNKYFPNYPSILTFKGW